MNANELPESFIRCMTEASKREIGLAVGVLRASPQHGEPVERESDLHQSIMDWCYRNYFPYIRSRMDKRTTTEKGVPDFVIFARANWKPVTLIVECKAKGNKLTKEQQSFIHQCKIYDHHAFAVWSMDDFNAVLKEVGL